MGSKENLTSAMLEISNVIKLCLFPSITKVKKNNNKFADGRIQKAPNLIVVKMEIVEKNRKKALKNKSMSTFSENFFCLLL